MKFKNKLIHIKSYKSEDTIILTSYNIEKYIDMFWAEIVDKHK